MEVVATWLKRGIGWQRRPSGTQSRLREALGAQMKEPRDSDGRDEGPERTGRVFRTFDSSPAEGG